MYIYIEDQDGEENETKILYEFVFLWKITFEHGVDPYRFIKCTECTHTVFEWG